MALLLFSSNILFNIRSILEADFQNGYTNIILIFHSSCRDFTITLLQIDIFIYMYINSHLLDSHHNILNFTIIISCSIAYILTCFYNKNI
jgi:protein associated with RNAse G/E